MDFHPSGMGEAQETAYRAHLAEGCRAALRKKFPARFQTPAWKRVDTPFRREDGEPYVYDLATHPPGTVIRSNAVDLIARGSTGIGVTTSVRARNPDGTPKSRTVRTVIPGERFDVDTQRWVKTRRVQVEQVPVYVQVCTAHGEPVARCCPWVVKRQQARTRAFWRAVRKAQAQGTPAPVPAVRGDAITKRKVYASDSIDCYGRTITGTPGQLRAEARRVGRYLKAGPGAE